MDKWANIICDLRNIIILCLNPSSGVLLISRPSVFWEHRDTRPFPKTCEARIIETKPFLLHVKGVICDPTRLPRENSFAKVRPDIPSETKHGLTHVVQMRPLEHFGYSSLSRALSLVLSSLAGRPPRPCLVRLPLYFSHGISKAAMWTKPQCPIILHVVWLVSIVTAPQCSEIRCSAIWRAALTPCGQLLYDAFIT